MVKTNKPCQFTVSFELCTPFKKLVQKDVKKRNLNMKVYILYNFTKVSVDWTSREFQNQTIYYFQERLSLQCNIILKLPSPFQIYF